MGREWVWAALGGAALVAAGSGAARAAEAVWPAYVWSGPGYEYQVIDEVLRGDTVAVLGCGPAWCQIEVGRGRGYVPVGTVAEVPVAATGQSAAIQQADPACFLAEQPTMSGGRAERFCPRNAHP